MRVAVEIDKACRLINHGPATLIGARAGGRSNVMAAAWVTALDFVPPKLTAVIAGGTLTRELIDASGVFTVQVPCAAQVDLVWTVGSVNGRDVDKIRAYDIGVGEASKVDAPLVEGCVAWLECRVVPEPHVQAAYDLFIAEVVAAWADDEVFSGGRWRDPPPAKRALHHLAKGTFWATGERLEASALTPKR